MRFQAFVTSIAKHLVASFQFPNPPYMKAKSLILPVVYSPYLSGLNSCYACVAKSQVCT